MEVEKVQEKIIEIEKEIADTPYHKGTEHHIGKLKARLAKLRTEILEKRTKKGGRGFAVKKEGDGTVVLVGFPSVGKSTLLNKLTAAQSKVADYPFTTLKVIPGILDYKGAKIQVLDVPGLVKDAAMGRGRGKEVLSIVRIADLLILMASNQESEAFEIMEKELYLAGVRLNKKRPLISIEKTKRGGIEVSGGSKLISKEKIKDLASDFGFVNAKIVLKEEITQEQLIDVFLGNRVYLPGLRVVSKIDLLPKKEFKKLFQKMGKEYLFVSALKNIGLERLKEEIFKQLNLMRIYLLKDLKKELKSQPFICKKGASVLDIAKKISQDLSKEIKGAKIKGPSADHDNQFVGLGHLLLDGDQVFFVKK